MMCYVRLLIQVRRELFGGRFIISYRQGVKIGQNGMGVLITCGGKNPTKFQKCVLKTGKNWRRGKNQVKLWVVSRFCVWGVKIRG